MNWKKASNYLIDYSEGVLSSARQQQIERLLRKDPKLAEELKKIRLLKKGIQTYAPQARVANPEKLTQKILSNIPAVTPATEIRKPRWTFEIPWTFRWPLPQWAWAATAAASLLITFLFGIQMYNNNQQLATLRHQQNNEKVLFQIAKIAYQQEVEASRQKLELTELMEWHGDMDAISVIDRSGKLPSPEAYQKIINPQTP